MTIAVWQPCGLCWSGRMLDTEAWHNFTLFVYLFGLLYFGAILLHLTWTFAYPIWYDPKKIWTNTHIMCAQFKDLLLAALCMTGKHRFFIIFILEYTVHTWFFHWICSSKHHHSCHVYSINFRNALLGENPFWKPLNRNWNYISLCSSELCSLRS